MTQTIERGALLPSTTLRTVPGGARTDLRAGPGARVVVFVHSAGCTECRGFVRELAATSHEIGDWGGRTLVVVPGDPASAAGIAAPGDGIEVLADSDGQVRSDGATVAVADEWGEIFAVFDIGESHAFPSGPELLEWIRFIAIQCPECEGPEGEWRSL